MQQGRLHTLSFIWKIDSEVRLNIKCYDKIDGFNFPIVNFPSLCNCIPAAPVNGVYISQLIRYSRACASYRDLLDRMLLLTFLQQGSCCSISSFLLSVLYIIVCPCVLLLLTMVLSVLLRLTVSDYHLGIFKLLCNLELTFNFKFDACICGKCI